MTATGVVAVWTESRRERFEHGYCRGRAEDTLDALTDEQASRQRGRRTYADV